MGKHIVFRIDMRYKSKAIHSAIFSFVVQFLSGGCPELPLQLLCRTASRLSWAGVAVIIRIRLDLRFLCGFAQRSVPAFCKPDTPNPNSLGAPADFLCHCRKTS